LNLGPHASFIVAAYAVAVAVIVLLIGWVAFDHRAQRRSLEKLEARGISRSVPRRAETAT